VVKQGGQAQRQAERQDWRTGGRGRDSRGKVEIIGGFDAEEGGGEVGVQFKKRAGPGHHHRVGEHVAPVPARPLIDTQKKE